MVYVEIFALTYAVIERLVDGNSKTRNPAVHNVTSRMVLDVLDNFGDFAFSLFDFTCDFAGI